MPEDLPEGLATSVSATLQHIHLIQAKADRLAEARRDALAQMLHRIGTEYRTGAITQGQLCTTLAAVRDIPMPGRMKMWDEIIGVPWKRVVQLARQLPNGPEGSWVGEYPILADAPRPIAGISVVYVLFDEANMPCYVGSTDKFSVRMGAHSKDGKRFVRWQAHPCKDREHAYLLEDRLLRRHLPYLNRKASR
ncbi:GIY-YIG nuclease family protein [Streptomyces sp. YIM S03343]